MRSKLLGWLVGALWGIAYMLLYSHALALDLTADNCTATEITNKANTILASGSGTLTLPPCTTANGTITIDGNGSGSLIIKGQGSGSTILQRTTSGTVMMLREMAYVELYDVGLESTQASGTSIAIDTYQLENFHFHDIEFIDSRWAGVVRFKQVRKGLIDNCYFDNHTKYSSISNYGIELGSNALAWDEVCDEDPINHTSCNITTCRSLYDIGQDISPGTWGHDCGYTWWNSWYNDSSTNFSIPYGGGAAQTWTPGSVDAIYIENNLFDWYGPSMEGNWSPRQAVVFRYNTVNLYRNGSSAWAIKPGSNYFENYNNLYQCNTSECLASPDIDGFYLRSDGVFYNNKAVNIQVGGIEAAWWNYSDYLYPTEALQTEQYVWGNTEDNVTCGDIDVWADCWSEWGEGDPTRIDLNVNYFFRAPTTGDRIYSGNPSLPVNQYTCPHPTSGVSGTCDNTKFGQDGYPSGGGSSTTGAYSGSGTGGVSFGNP